VHASFSADALEGCEKNASRRFLGILRQLRPGFETIPCAGELGKHDELRAHISEQGSQLSDIFIRPAEPGPELNKGNG
jgi:hypothetical protein